MQIPPISFSHGNASNFSDPKNTLQKMLEEIRNSLIPEWENISSSNPPSTHLIDQTKSALRSIEDFLQNNKKVLIQDSYANNWPKFPDPDSCESFIDSTVSAIQNFESCTPEEFAKSGDAIIDSINEFVTQVNYRVTTPYPGNF